GGRGEGKGRPEEGDGLRVQAFDGGVVVARIVVKGDEPRDPAEVRELDCVAEGAVAPADARRVLVVAVLRGGDEEVRSMGAPGSGGRLRGGSDLVTPEGGFVVGEMGDGSIGGGDPVAERGARVADEGRRDVELADF